MTVPSTSSCSSGSRPRGHGAPRHLRVAITSWVTMSCETSFTPCTAECVGSTRASSFPGLFRAFRGYLFFYPPPRVPRGAARCARAGSGSTPRLGCPLSTRGHVVSTVCREPSALTPPSACPCAGRPPHRPAGSITPSGSRLRHRRASEDVLGSGVEPAPVAPQEPRLVGAARHLVPGRLLWPVSERAGGLLAARARRGRRRPPNRRLDGLRRRAADARAPR